MENYVIGLDYGTDSVRSVLIDTGNDAEIASSVYQYPRWKAGKFCDPVENRLRQHPLDHIGGLEHTIKMVVSQNEIPPEAVKGICIDTTGSSPMPVTADGTPLALTERFDEKPNAMMVLWKDHTSIQ